MDHPKFLTETSTCLHHYIVVLSVQDINCIHTPLSRKGTTSYFSTMRPTLHGYRLAEKDPYMEKYYDQDIVTEEKLHVDNTRICFLVSRSILEGIDER